LGGAADCRSDIFAFGALVYEMASGRRAFPGEGAALDRAILERPPAILKGLSPIHAAMEGVVAGCIDKDPARRRQRVQNVVTELKLGRMMARLAGTRQSPSHRAWEPEMLPWAVAGYPMDEETEIQPGLGRFGAPIEFPAVPAALPREGRRRLATILLLGLALITVAAAVLVGILYARSRIAFPRADPAPVNLRHNPSQARKFAGALPGNVTHRMPTASGYEL
jgi:serine/threonine-protein kinase